MAAGILVAYKGAIALVVVALSIANRHIKRKEFQHTKRVNMLVYSLALVWGAGMPLYFILSDFDIHISFLVMCLMLIAAIFLCSAMLFLPTVIPILKQKLGLSNKDHGRKTPSAAQTEQPQVRKNNHKTAVDKHLNMDATFLTSCTVKV